MLFEDKAGEKNQNDRPDHIKRLGYLPRQPRVSFKKNKVITKGHEHAQQSRSEIIFYGLGSQSGYFFSVKDNPQKDKKRYTVGPQQQRRGMGVAEAQLEDGGYGSPEKDSYGSIEISFFLRFFRRKESCQKKLGYGLVMRVGN